MKIEVLKYRLDFKFEAGTSRGVMTSKDSYFLKLYDRENPDVFGIGECSPLAGLSPDLEGDLQGTIEECSHEVQEIDRIESLNSKEIVSSSYPALQFALETAILDLSNGGRRVLYENAFTKSQQDIPINGLVWMGDKALMLQRIKSKIEEGFTCIKIKIGAINFEDELALLKYIRTQFSSDQITIRLDANGAFDPAKAIGILDQLSKYDIHSIEQPIMAGNWDAMQQICNRSPIPVALDEELIGIYDEALKIQLLEYVKPDYIILKPTLLGGLSQSNEWIKMATKRDINWWITSALESNIGLNAISQFTANYPIDLPQGLGTGQLFYNNIPSPLMINNGLLSYSAKQSWDLGSLN